VSKAVIIAVAVNTEGVREGLGTAIGSSEAEPFWTGLLRSLTGRGLRGVKLVISAKTHDSYTTSGDSIKPTQWTIAVF
jgi:putative transposase